MKGNDPEKSGRNGHGLSSGSKLYSRFFYCTEVSECHVVSEAWKSGRFLKLQVDWV